MTAGQIMAREALDLRLRLEFGLASLDEVELWADAWLLAFDKPRDELVDLALASRADLREVKVNLDKLGGGKPRGRDILRAVRVVDIDTLSDHQLETLLDHIANCAESLVDDPDKGTLHEAVSICSLFELRREGSSDPATDPRLFARRFFQAAREMRAE